MHFCRSRRFKITREAVENCVVDNVRDKRSESEPPTIPLLLSFSSMASLQQLLKPSWTSLFAPSLSQPQPQPQPRTFTTSTPRASLQNSSINRRQFVAETAAAVSLSLSPLIAPVQPAKSEEALSEWERLFLPIDPGVVLLDIAFVPDDLDHG